MHWRGFAETLTITVAAILAALGVFGLFTLAYEGKSPLDLYHWMYMGSFGSKFAWQNTLTRAAPLLLTALCTAIPARLGLIVIGGEGALVIGGLVSVSMGLLMPNMPVLSVQIAMALAGMAAGGLLIAAVGFLRHWRGVNEVISSLLITYIALAIFNYLVEGPMRDPASLNKPSTYPIGKEFMLGNMFGMDIHWGLAFGVVYCIVMWVLLDHTTFGFAARMVGGNVRSAQASGLPVGQLILICCALAGGAAGLAGMVEIAAVHRQANASLNAMYGFTGILVSFIARHHPLGVMPAAILFGGLSAASGLLQRRMGLPDASMGVFMGTIFVIILMFETFYGRIGLFQPKYKEPVVVEVPPRLAPRPAEEVVAK